MAALPRRTLPLAGQRQAALARARTRLMTCVLLFVAIAGILGLRLADLALLHERDTGGREAFAAPIPPRGDIFDRNGIELARTFDAVAVAVAPRKLIGDPHALAQSLAAILTDKTPGQIYFELTHPGAFRYIARRVLPEQAKRINDLGEPAITLEREPERLYPNADLAAHVIGYTDIDGHGKYGMERALDTRLTAPATRGKPVFLALDSRVQQALENELGAAMAEFTALGAAGIVMDVHTGEVIALASLPDFNPNAAGHASDNARFNRATLGVYELGSTFKTMTIAMSLNDGFIKSMDQKYDATAPIHIGRFTIHDDPDGHELRRWASVPDIFIHSSNIGTAHMAAELGATRQRAYLDALGFLSPVSGELMERGHTLYPASNNWGEIATMTVGFGHGIAVTPLHLATAYATVVNGGIFRPATMLKVEPGQAVPGKRIFKESTSDQMRALLRMVVLSGTGRKANAAGYRVGGKTGTAEKQQGGHYEKHVNISTFAAAFPMDAPRYVVIALLDAPHGTKKTGGYSTAGQVSAPIIEKIVTRIGPMLGVAPDMTHDIDVNGMLGLAASAPDKE
ncbi:MULTISPECIES: peptidoglycan D,D-transpeptidase FtsI family protein [Sphingosinicellaceae]|uniref:peptidoglycan D,D-transpeptidase FtsI family protein n=1 Tax=Sphingosinicellaceae TaxID=2820280 RepID=UPI001C1DD6EF|nr:MULTISPECIES: penicillin-binding protein 2 [Polymorphobacter]QYE35096.1 penicillin-binding protein 2 [Polymorphobacter sp. PAMC 29334]UAJ12005.1 penicillin-binding protein 2 [Polymorphobacter megasporae]